ncbi:MAG: hypothetical protein ACQEQ4_09735 [Fibrobacterota bacterium]
MKIMAQKAAFLIALHLVIQVSAGMIPLREKGELLLRGSVTDEQGYVYNVHILPGYDTPLKIFRQQMLRGGRHQYRGTKRIISGIGDIPRSFRYFHDYVTPTPWHTIYDEFEASMEAEKAIIGDFMIRDLGATWKSYMQRAADLREKRAIGWIFSYPWYAARATINSTLRIAGGAVAAPSVFTYATVLRPAWEISLPVFKTGGSMVAGTAQSIIGAGEITWGLVANQAVGAVTTPLSLNAWNTALGIPTALLSRMPTPETSVNWWVSVEGEPSLKKVTQDEAAPERAIIVDTPALTRDYLTFIEVNHALDDSLAKIDSVVNADITALEYRCTNAENRYRKAFDEYNVLRDSLETLQQSIRKTKEEYASTTLTQSGFSPQNKGIHASKRAYLQDILNTGLNSNTDTTQPVSTGDNSLQRSFIRQYGERYISGISTEEAPPENFNPHTIVGDEIDTLIQQYR